MQTYGLVRNNEQELNLRCGQQEYLRVDIQIPFLANGWTVNDDSHFHQMIHYNDIKALVFHQQQLTTDFWFSRGKSLVDVTDFAPIFKFNSHFCILNPPPSFKLSSGNTLLGGRGNYTTTVSGNLCTIL